MIDLLKKLQNLVHSYYIEYNSHKDVYETIETFLNNHDADKEEIIDYDKMIETDTLFWLQVYPDSPIGFNRLFGSSLEICLEKMLKN